MDYRDVLIKPVVSEKSYDLQEQGAYTFLVHPRATKPEIHDAVERLFQVRVVKVNTLNRKGKKRTNRQTGTVGSRPATKRAIVTLVEGDTLDIFE